MKDRMLKRDIKRLLNDAEISVVSNTDWDIILVSPRTSAEYSLSQMGDVEDIPFEDLLAIVKKGQRGLFENYKLIIDDVYVEGDYNITIEDVEKALGIRHKDKLDEVPDSDYLDDLLLDESVEDFYEIVKKMSPQVQERLIERAIDLYKREEFSNAFKMNMLEKLLDVEDIWKDIDRINK